MWKHCICLLAGLALAAAPAPADEDRWTIRFSPVHMTAYGHDQHVLTIHEVAADAVQTSTRTGVNVTTDSGLAYRLEAMVRWKRWDWGMDLLWFVTSQGGAGRSGAPGAALDSLVYEVSGRSYASSDPAASLYYRLLEDNDLAMWTFDLYGRRPLVQNDHRGLDLQLGLRIGDFDNDYRAAVGVEGVGGSRLDRSSNYAALVGPHIGLTGSWTWGDHVLEAGLGQSVLVGTADLFGTTRDFTGPFSETPAVVAFERVYREQDVAIPITEIRLGYRYLWTKHLAWTVGINSSAWWDVPVPPGTVPGDGGIGAFHENTVVLFGLQGGIEYRF